MSIIQGSNKPIVIVLDENISSATDIVVSVSYLANGKCLKHWHKANVTFGTVVVEEETKYTITCPLTQQDTLAFPHGDVVIDLKWLTNGSIEFNGRIFDKVEKRECKEPLTEPTV